MVGEKEKGRKMEGKNGGWREKKGRWEVGKESNEQLAKEGKITSSEWDVYMYIFASRVSIGR